MSPATPWTKLTAPATSYSEAFPILGSTEDDFFTVFLFDGPALEVLGAVAYSQMSLAGGTTPTTELTTPSAAWTEIVL